MATAATTTTRAQTWSGNQMQLVGQPFNPRQLPILLQMGTLIFPRATHFQLPDTSPNLGSLEDGSYFISPTRPPPRPYPSTLRRRRQPPFVECCSDPFRFTASPPSTCPPLSIMTNTAKRYRHGIKSYKKLFASKVPPPALIERATVYIDQVMSK